MEVGRQCDALNEELGVAQTKIKMANVMLRETRSSLEVAKKALIHSEINKDYTMVARWQNIIQVDKRLLNGPTAIVVDNQFDTDSQINDHSPTSHTTVDEANDVILLNDMTVEKAKDVILLDDSDIDGTFVPAMKANGERKRTASVHVNPKRKVAKVQEVFIPKDSFCVVLKNGIKNGWRTSLEEFNWSAGKVFCNVCHKGVSHTRHLKQHVGTKKHQKKREDMNRASQALTRTQCLETVLENNPYSVASSEEKLYRMEGLLTIALANIGIGQFTDLLPWIEKNSKEGLNMGHASKLTRLYAKPALDFLLKQISSRNSFPQFSLSIDGTPSFAEAECIIVRFVNKNYQIIEIVARIALFERKLNSDELANHVLNCINTRLMVPLCDWTTVQLDRASTNKAAIRKLKDTYPDATPVETKCV